VAGPTRFAVGSGFTVKEIFNNYLVNLKIRERHPCLVGDFQVEAHLKRCVALSLLFIMTAHFIAPDLIGLDRRICFRQQNVFGHGNAIESETLAALPDDLTIAKVLRRSD